MRMKERLYLTEDRLSVVSADDRKGRFLLCKKGAELDDKIAKYYGLVDGELQKTNLQKLAQDLGAVQTTKTTIAKIKPKRKRKRKRKRGGLEIVKLDGSEL